MALPATSGTFTQKKKTPSDVLFRHRKYLSSYPNYFMQKKSGTSNDPFPTKKVNFLIVHIF